MIPGILGKKVGMTQIFDEDGRKIAVTVVEAGPCVVQSVKSLERNGYNAVQIGFDETKESRLKKPQREDIKAKKLAPKKFMREIKCNDVPEEKVGDEFTVSIFQKGDFLDITAKSKGKGFQGGMKRHNWSGGKATHGSMSHRVPGSIGASSYPSRVFKGQSMPGHMGDIITTVQNVEVMDVDAENNTIILKGAIPGTSRGYLVIRYAKKRVLASRIEEEEPQDEAGSEEQVLAENPVQQKAETKPAEKEKEKAEEKKNEKVKEDSAEDKKQEKNTKDEG